MNLQLTCTLFHSFSHPQIFKRFQYNIMGGNLTDSCGSHIRNIPEVAASPDGLPRHTVAKFCDNLITCEPRLCTYVRGLATEARYTTSTVW
jgi:hypothetical protein